MNERYRLLGSVSESDRQATATRIGRAALRAVADLSLEPKWRGGKTRRWVESDYTSFASVANCLHELDEANFSGVPASSYSRSWFTGHLEKLYGTLPFTETERRFVVSKVNEGYSLELEHPKSPKDFASFVAKNGRTTYEAGRQHGFDGRDLFKAWWAWRRGAFEFADRYAEYDMTTRELRTLRTVDMARDALHAIAGTFLPLPRGRATS